MTEYNHWSIFRRHTQRVLSPYLKRILYDSKFYTFAPWFSMILHWMFKKSNVVRQIQNGLCVFTTDCLTDFNITGSSFQFFLSSSQFRWRCETIRSGYLCCERQRHRCFGTQATVSVLPIAEGPLRLATKPAFSSCLAKQPAVRLATKWDVNMFRRLVGDLLDKYMIQVVKI